MVEVTVDTSGLDKIQEVLSNGEIEVPVVEILNPAFIFKETSYPDLESLVRAANIDPDGADDYLEERLASEEFSEFLKKCSRFSSFTEMCETAGEEFLLAKIEGA